MGHKQTFGDSHTVDGRSRFIVKDRWKRNGLSHFKDAFGFSSVLCQDNNVGEKLFKTLTAL